MALTAIHRKAPRGMDLTVDAIVRDAVSQLERLASLQTTVIEAALVNIVSPTDARAIVRVAKALTNFMAERASSTQQPSKLPKELAAQATSARTELVAKKRVVTAGDMLKKLGVTRQALSKAVNAHRLFAVEVGGERLYPAFFADPELDRRQLGRVAKELGELPGWSKWQFFTTPKASLGGITPIDALKRGRYTEARRAAIGFLER